MALDFQSRVTGDQKQVLSDFVSEEGSKASRKKRRLEFLAGKAAGLRDRLDDLQTEDLKYISSTTNTDASKQGDLIPPPVQQKTLAAFDAQTQRVTNGVPRGALPGTRHFTLPSVSAAVDDVKTPLLEAVKGRFERLEYAIRRAADRTEVLELRTTKQDTLQSDLEKALSRIQVQE